MDAIWTTDGHILFVICYLNVGGPCSVVLMSSPGHMIANTNMPAPIVLSASIDVQ